MAEQVEDLVDERRRSRFVVRRRRLDGATLGRPSARSVQAGDPPAGRLGDPRLEEREVGSPGRVERDDLAVEDRVLGRDPLRRRWQQPREVGRRVVTVPGVDPDLAVGEDRLDPVAVPLDLEQPVRIVERAVGQRGQHRLEEGRRPLGGLGRRQVDLGLGGRRLADPVRVAVGLDLVVRPAGLDARRVVLGVPAVDRRLVALVDEQPLLALVGLEGAGPRPASRGAHDREPPAGASRRGAGT